MWARLTYNGTSWDLPVAGLSMPTDDNGTPHGKHIFRDWAKAAMKAVGWAPFQESNFDSDHRSIGFSDGWSGDTVLRTHTAILAPIEALKARKIAALEAHWQTVVNSGLVFSVGSIPLQTDDPWRAEALAAARFVDQGGSLPADYKWKDMAGNWVPVSSANAAKYANELAQHYYFARVNLKSHEDAINALSDQQAVVDYDFSSGWPANPVVP